LLSHSEPGAGVSGDSHGKITGVRVLDSHLHLWDPDTLTYGWLTGDLLRRFGPKELDKACGLAPHADQRGFVFVQADCVAEQSLAEVDWVLDLSDQFSLRGIVAFAPVSDGVAVGHALEELQCRPMVVGVRQLLQDQTPGLFTSAAFISGARQVAGAGFTFDACVRAGQLDELADFADRVPELTVVLDHLGKPPLGRPDIVGRPDDEDWSRALRALARRPNVVCKLSGLPAEGPGGGSAIQVRPFLDIAADAFGSDRLIFGGDWPVSRPYGVWLELVTTWLSGTFTPAQQEAILWTNAERVYALA
jgi:L-fuconolactonase